METRRKVTPSPAARCSQTRSSAPATSRPTERIRGRPGLQISLCSLQAGRSSPLWPNRISRSGRRGSTVRPVPEPAATFTIDCTSAIRASGSGPRRQRHAHRSVDGDDTLIAGVGNDTHQRRRFGNDSLIARPADAGADTVNGDAGAADTCTGVTAEGDTLTGCECSQTLSSAPGLRCARPAASALSASVEAPVAVAVSAEVEAGVVGSAVVVSAEWEGGGQVGAAALGPGVEVVDLATRRTAARRC